MAEEGKKIEFGIALDGTDFQSLMEKLRQLEQAAKGVANSFAAIKTGTSGGAGGAALPGVPTPASVTGGMGAAGDPEIVRIQTLKKSYEDLTTALKNYRAEKDILGRAAGGTGSAAPTPAGLVDASGRLIRPLDTMSVATPSGSARGPAYSALEAQTVNINAQTVNINGNVSGGGGDGAGGGGTGAGTGGTADGPSPTSRGRGGTSFQSKMAAVQTAIGVAETGIDLYKYYTTSGLKNQAGQQAYNTYMYQNLLSGKVASLAAIQEMGGYSAIQNQYGMAGANTASKYLSMAGGVAQAATGVAGMLTGAAAGAVVGTAVGGPVGGVIGAIGGGVFGSMVTRGVSTAGRSAIDLMTGKVDAEEQQNIVAAIEEYKKTKPFEYMAMDLFDQQRGSMVASQRALGRVGIGGPRAFDLANILPATYGFSMGDAMGIAQSAARGRSFRGNEDEYKATMSVLGGLQAAGYSGSFGSGLMNMVGLLEIGGYAPPNAFKRGGRKAFGESALLGMFGFGDQNVDEAVVSRVQAGLMGYGGLASSGGIGAYANMLGSGVTNAQQVMLRQQGIAALGAMAQEPLSQAMSMMEFKRLVPQATVAQQQIAAKLKPEEYMDTEKIMRLINPYGPRVVNGIPQAGYLKEFAKAQMVGERMTSQLFDVAQSQVVERSGELGKLLKGKGKGFLGSFIEGGQTDPKYAGYMEELAQSIAGTVGGVEQGRQMIEAYARRKVKVSGGTAADAADPRLVGQERLTAATQTEALYAGFNQALTTLQSTFSNAQSEITNIISQLSNNTAANMTGGKMVGSVK